MRAGQRSSSRRGGNRGGGRRSSSNSRRNAAAPSLTSGIWLRALEEHDAVATALLHEAVQALGVAIGSAVTLLDVERVVIGGGLGERLGPAWIKRIEKAAKHHTFFRPPPDYVQAELGDMGGAIGASLLASRNPPSGSLPLDPRPAGGAHP